MNARESGRKSGIGFPACRCAHAGYKSGSERADGEIAQPQIGETALFPQAEQGPVERLTQRVVAAPDRDADAFAEVAALGERAAAKLAAVPRVGAVEPEGELSAVAEQEIDLAPAQRLAGGFRG